MALEPKPLALDNQGTRAREEMCLRCGRCCYHKILLDGRVHYTSVPCQYLDTCTRLCQIYPRRFELNPQCLTLEEGIHLGVFPGDCPYVREILDYRAPLLVEDQKDVPIQAQGSY